jgi:anthranilate synthase component 2
VILLVDNYDSFTYNLYQILGTFEPNIEVIRNDCLDVENIRRAAPSHLVISPGPGRPENAGSCSRLIERLAGCIPLLGICLGHQAICQVFGARITYAPTLMHGKTSLLTVDTASTLFADLPQHFEGARYHSLMVDPATLPSCLRVTARADDNTIMAIEHVTQPVFGLQFHPESILTPQGSLILKNFLSKPLVREQQASGSQESTECALPFPERKDRT